MYSWFIHQLQFAYRKQFHHAVEPERCFWMNCAKISIIVGCRVLHVTEAASVSSLSLCPCLPSSGTGINWCCDMGVCLLPSLVLQSSGKVEAKTYLCASYVCMSSWVFYPSFTHTILFWFFFIFLPRFFHLVSRLLPNKPLSNNKRKQKKSCCFLQVLALHLLPIYRLFI